jgi:hypothetical protein
MLQNKRSLKWPKNGKKCVNFKYFQEEIYRKLLMCKTCVVTIKQTKDLTDVLVVFEDGAKLELIVPSFLSELT